MYLVATCGHIPAGRCTRCTYSRTCTGYDCGGVGWRLIVGKSMSSLGFYRTCFKRWGPMSRIPYNENIFGTDNPLLVLHGHENIDIYICTDLLNVTRHHGARTQAKHCLMNLKLGCATIQDQGRPDDIFSTICKSCSLLTSWPPTTASGR